MTHGRRKDDPVKKSWFRSERFIQEGGKWFFFTREGTIEGPFEDKLAAVRQLDIYLTITSLGLIESDFELARPA